MATNNIVEIFLKLNAEAMKQGVDTAKRTVVNMGGTIEKTLKKSNSLWQAGGRAADAYKGKLRDVNGAAGELKSTLTQVLGLVGGGLLFTAAGKSAVGFNSTIDQSQIGLAALARTFNEFPESVDVYADSMDVAAEIQRNLQIEGLKTVATYEQLLVALQEGLGPAFRRGFDPAQAVEFISLMTQAAAANNLPMDQLGQEVRSILDGTIDKNSRVAKSLDITSKKVEEMAAKGKLFDYLKGKLFEFGRAGEDMAKTWTGAWSNLMDATQMGLGTGLENSYNALTTLFLNLRDVIVDIDEEAGTFTFNERIVAAIDKADTTITSFIKNITDKQLEDYLVIITETGAAVIEMFVSFLQMLKWLADSLGSSLPTVAKWTAAFVLFGGALKLLIGVPMIVVKQLMAMDAAFAAMSGGSILLYLKHVQQASKHTGILKTAFASVPNALAAAGGVMAAAFVGWQIGTWLYEQFDIVKQAGNRIAATFTWIGLKAKKAWAWVSGGDTAAVQREIDQASKIYRQMFDDIGQGAKEAGGAHKKVADSAKSSASMQAKAQKGATEAMKKAYKSYADTVKKLQDDIAGREQSLAEQLREMGRSGMSEMSAWKDRKAEAEEFAKSARKAEKAAEAAFAAGDTATGETKFKEAVEYYDKAKDAAADLNTEITAGDRVIQTQGQSLKIAKGLVEEYGRAGIDVEKKHAEAIKETARALDEKSGYALSTEMPEIAKAFEDLSINADELAQKSAEFNDKWNEAWDDFLKDGGDAIYDLDTKLSQLTKDKHIKVYVKEVIEKATGGSIGALRMAAGGGVQAVRDMLGGGHFPGFGGGDRRHVIAEDGEYMFDKFRVKDAGLDVVRAFHAGDYSYVISELMKRVKGSVSRQFGGVINRIPSLPQIGPQYMQDGGSVQGNSAGSVIRHEHNLRSADGRQATVYTDDLNAPRLIGILQDAMVSSS
jgi:tetratricopeptide (TPR) repeat protein